MNQSQFVKKVASEMGVSIPEAKLWVVGIFEVLTNEIMTQDKVTIMNFGIFKRKQRAALRRGNVKNPGETVEYPPKTVVTFEVSPFIEYMAEKDFPLKN